MNKRLALADRVEKLTGPDREVDAEIAKAVGWHPAGIDARLLKTDAAWLYLKRAPAYTASLDAAMTLVPEGWFTKLAMQDRHSLRWKWELRGGFGHNCSAWAASPALAILTAALRARAHGGGE